MLLCRYRKVRQGKATELGEIFSQAQVYLFSFSYCYRHYSSGDTSHPMFRGT